MYKMGKVDRFVFTLSSSFLPLLAYCSKDSSFNSEDIAAGPQGEGKAPWNKQIIIKTVLLLI